MLCLTSNRHTHVWITSQQARECALLGIWNYHDQARPVQHLFLGSLGWRFERAHHHKPPVCNIQHKEAIVVMVRVVQDCVQGCVQVHQAVCSYLSGATRYKFAWLLMGPWMLLS